jgi:hypothetical protein
MDLAAGRTSFRDVNAKRPCVICRHWFQPNSRVGPRQRACSLDACQREAHRRACASWRQRNPDYDREARLHSRLQPVPEPTTAARSADPLRGVDWTAARVIAGLPIAVLMRQTGQLLLDWTREEMRKQHAENTDESSRVHPARARDEMPGDPRVIASQSVGHGHRAPRDETDGERGPP